MASGHCSKQDLTVAYEAKRRVSLAAEEEDVCALPGLVGGCGKRGPGGRVWQTGAKEVLMLRLQDALTANTDVTMLFYNEKKKPNCSSRTLRFGSTNKG